MKKIESLRAVYIVEFNEIDLCRHTKTMLFRRT